MQKDKWSKWETARSQGFMRGIIREALQWALYWGLPMAFFITVLDGLRFHKWFIWPNIYSNLVICTIGGFFAGLLFYAIMDWFYLKSRKQHER